MPVDAFASYPHYYHHLLPIWNALANKGTFYVTPAAGVKGDTVRALGGGPPVLVAGYPDITKTRHRAHILVEHGVGEYWNATDAHYSGGAGRGSVILFINPNHQTAERNRRMYPNVPSVVVGSPRLEWLAQLRTSGEIRWGRRDDRLRVVISFHWDNHTWPHTRSALMHYQPMLKSYAGDSRIEIRGHVHPRIIDKAERVYAQAGIHTFRHFDDVVPWADVYAVDNSPTLFEAMALGIPVVALDAPWFTPLEGSWRFDRYPGPVADPLSFVDSVICAHAEPMRYDDLVAEMFGAVDGAAERAARAIQSVTNDSLRPQSRNTSPDTGAEPAQPSLLDSR